MRNGAGFRRISARVEEWRQICGPFVCAGAGARGWCDITLHSSISSIQVKKMEGKQLIERVFLGFFEMEAKRVQGEGMER